MHVSDGAERTAFCAAKLEAPDGTFLWLDGNGKITAGNGTLDVPRPNAFSLVQVEDCPGSTPSCRQSCYVHGLEKHAPDTHALYRHNSTIIRRILSDESESLMWMGLLGMWIEQNAPHGFRWHVSGDVFSLDYAWWIAEVCRCSPSTLHWIYTRSFGNLVLNLSCDRDNYGAASMLAKVHGLRLCYLTLDGNVPGDLPDDSVIFPDYSLRQDAPAGKFWHYSLPPRQKKMVCPVDFFGKTEQRRCGPCDRCMK